MGSTFQVPTKANQVQAMYEIGAAEICAACTKVPVFWRAIAKAEDKEEFWDIWLKESEESLKNFHLVRVLVVGYANEEQMDYELAVLDDIFEKLEGKKRRTKASDESWLKNADSAGMWLMTGSYVSVEFVIETLNQSVQHGEAFAALKASEYTPPLFPDFGDPGWFQLFENGHQGYSEFLIYWDQDEDTSGVDRFFLQTSKMNIENNFYSSHLGPHQPLFLTGPQYGPNYHLWLLKVKNEFDPASVLPPTCTSGTRCIRSESRMDARYDRLGSSRKVPNAKLDCYYYSVVSNIFGLINIKGLLHFGTAPYIICMQIFPLHVIPRCI